MVGGGWKAAEAGPKADVALLCNFVQVQLTAKGHSNVESEVLGQRSPTFLAPGTGFVEDSFSTERGIGGDGSGGNASGR